MKIRSTVRMLGSLLALSVGLPAIAALKVGDVAPDFTAQASLAGKIGRAHV